ncbi:ankyrin repeat domain-containing protein [Candidatus Berkiella cookevillensis]|uniref:Ankyrin repeat domain-containing protein n=1 Tax=Candidatus Berkiella cookevillensis TaxID=437022 RepID=A0A0Q9YD96_9GAMM|nr:ankyrin repeat domain-containing protein [Candidatus Berkiella cookevillensis]MCS5707898.1 ankyrin repeat domain-containing protein [Candidatus Berkiella cookevillensis]
MWASPKTDTQKFHMLQFILSHKSDFQFKPNHFYQNIYNEIQQLITLAEQEYSGIEIDKKQVETFLETIGSQLLSDVHSSTHTVPEALKALACFYMLKQNQLLLDKARIAFSKYQSQLEQFQHLGDPTDENAKEYDTLGASALASKKIADEGSKEILQQLATCDIIFPNTLSNYSELSNLLKTCIADFNHYFVSSINYYRILNHHGCQLFAEDMNVFVEQKNARHQKLGGPFHGKVICSQTPSSLALLDPIAFDTLSQDIQDIQTGFKPRTQFYIYANVNFSHCMALDIEREEDGTLHILSFDSAQHIAQYYLLEKLTAFLEKNKINFKITACQSGLQRSMINCEIFSHLFLQDSAKVRLAPFMAKLAEIEQPAFSSITPKFVKSYAPLSKVKWCSVADLQFPKLLLSRHGLSQLEVDIHTLGEKLGKIRLGDDPHLFTATELNQEHREVFVHNEQNTFIAIKFNRFYQKIKNTLATFDIATLKENYKRRDADPTPTEYLALRLAASGQRPKPLMEQLIAYLVAQPNGAQNLDTQDDNIQKRKTALHWALDNGNAMRAAMLIIAGCKIDIPDAQGRTAKSIYAESTVKSIQDNPVLQQKLG